MIRIHALGIVAFAVFGLSALSSAQSRNELPSQPYLSMRQQSAWLLNYPMIVRSLQLSAAEEQALSQAKKAYEGDQQQVSARGVPTDAQIEGLDRKFADTMLAALTSAHRERLFQALLQVQGAEALTDQGIASRLGLTAGERERIHEIFAAADKREEDFEASLAEKLLAVPRIAPASLYVKKRNEVISAAAPQRTQLAKERRADEDKALGVLSAKQKTTWKELLGNPVVLSRRPD